MEPSSTTGVSTLPPLPPLKGFSSCFFGLESLRSTTETIQRSLVAHYADLCRDCEKKAALPAGERKKGEEEAKNKAGADAGGGGKADSKG